MSLCFNIICKVIEKNYYELRAIAPVVSIDKNQIFDDIKYNTSLKQRHCSLTQHNMLLYSMH
jgi:hypothetical protein